MHKNYKYVVFLFLFFFTFNVIAIEPKTTEYRSWIVEMKSSPKGPFIRVQWFCNDGEKLPPKAYACREHGGGHQHGELSRKALILENKGYRVMSFLAGIEPKKTLRRKDFIDWYNQLLIQKFLISSNNGWILEKAQFYRGAIQEEDERDGARQLLAALTTRSEWLNQRYLGLRIGVQLLAHGEDTASVQKVRQMTVSLVEKDKGFSRLRTKIHVAPDAGNAELVREYALKTKYEQLKPEYFALAKEIDRIFDSPPLAELLENTAKRFRRGKWVHNLLLDTAKRYAIINSPENHYAVTAQLLADLRDALPKIGHIKSKLRLLDLSLAVEAINFKASTQLYSQLDTTRQRRLAWLQHAAFSAYGTGHINQRSLDALNSSLNQLKDKQIPLDTYFKELNYLSRAPGWSTQELRFQFYRSMIKLAEIEPIAKLFIQDMLRGSPMFFYSQVLDSLSRDVNHLAGVSHQLFGQTVGVGLHALNPGLARGTLYTQADINDFKSFNPQGIYLLPETISDLPPVAGIITVGEGNPLSHVQLLARNLGIPNVTIDQSLLKQLQEKEGEAVVLAVSSKGLVELNSDSAEWQAFFNEKSEQQQDVVIRPNLEKLDLTKREFIDLSSLRASDSGRTVGPKAAKLGELYHHYPGKVANGIAIPFGLFREAVLDKPYKNTDQTVFQWMESQYALIDAFINAPEVRKQAMESFRAEIYEVIINTKMPVKYQNELRLAMRRIFGSTRAGAFIRSDTNVEDLPGFTGAGLNLTLFNVVGMKNIINGITKVWASPFTPRAFAWRQSLMEMPQHVYPAILIMKTVANEKSGVMVTQDLDSGEMGVLSVASNEGVGGAVDGQSAESLRIGKDGTIRLLATATAVVRKKPLRRGGVAKLPVSGSDTVLKANEIKQLIQFAKEIPNTFPPIIDDEGNRAAADVEFGFYKGKLQLFQLRPFLQSKKAKSNSYLINMDKALHGNMDRLVSMTEATE